MMRLTTTLLCLLLLPLFVYSQALKGTVRVGENETYPSLTGDGGLFQNLKNLSGDLDVLICSDLQENGKHMLGVTTTSIYTIRIRPNAAQMRTIFNGAKGTPTLRLNGKARVVVDGRFPHRSSNDYTQAERPNMEGRFLRFVNGTPSGSSGIPNTAIEVQYGSQGHVISSCLFQSMEQGGYGSCILLGYGTGKISDLLIEYCDFGSITWQEGWADTWKQTQQVGFGIYAPKTATEGSKRVRIAHNRFYNTQWAGICFIDLHADWEISDNTFQKSGEYLTALKPSFNGLEAMPQYSYTAIWAEGTGAYHITGNQIGGKADSPLALTAYKPSDGPSSAPPFAFQGIYAKGVQATAEADIRITGNQIAYLRVYAWESSTGPNKLLGIAVGNRRASITGNTIQGVKMSITPNASSYYSALASQLSGMLLESSKYETTVADNLISDCQLIGYKTFNNATALLLRGIYANRDASSDPLQLLRNRIQNISGTFKYPVNSSTRKADAAYGIQVTLASNSSPTCLLEGNQVTGLSIADLSGSTALDAYTPSAYGIQAYGQLTDNRVSGMQVAGKAVGIELLGAQGSLRGNRLWDLQARQLTGFRCSSAQPHFHNSSRQQGGTGWEQTATGGQLYHNALYIEEKGATLTGGATAKPLIYPSGTTVQNNLLLAPHVRYSDLIIKANNLLVSSDSAQASSLINQKSLLFRDWAGGDLRLRTTGDLSPCIALLDLLVDKGTYTTVLQDAEGTPYAGAPDCGLTEFVHRWEGPAAETDANQIAYWPLRTPPTSAHPCSQHVLIPSGTACLWKDIPLPLRSLQVAGNLRLSGNMAISQQMPSAASPMKGLWVLPGGALDMKDYTGTLSLSQDLLVEGSWISGAHGLQLSGMGSQLLQSATPIAIEKLTVNKAVSSTCQVQLPLEAKQLDMQQGVLDIGPDYPLVIRESTTGGSTGARVMGWVKYQGNAEAVLPLGAMGRYAPLKVDGGPLEACFVDSIPPDTLVDIAQQGYWRLRAQQATLCAVAPLMEGHVQLWRHLPDIKNWEHLQTVTITQGLLQSSLPEGEVLFTTGNAPQVAPTWDLLLSARREGETVRLAWTYKGLPVLGFGIEHSQDGVSFAQVGKVEGDARTFSERRSETGYYRLKIWQREGGSGYSRPIALEGAQVQGLSLWPNPWGQEALQLHTEEKGEILLQLCDLQGRQVAQWRTRTADGRLYWSLPPLPSGCYLLILSGPQGRHCGRLIVQ